MRTKEVYRFTWLHASAGRLDAPDCAACRLGTEHGRGHEARSTHRQDARAIWPTPIHRFLDTVPSSRGSMHGHEGVVMRCLFITFLLMLPVHPALADAGLKEQIKGLIDRQDTSWINENDGIPQFTMANVNKFPGLFSGVVINTSWNALQPDSPDGLDASTIGGPLAQISTYNSQHPDRPLAVKLRVWAGANAPPWAKSLDGAPVTIYRNKIGDCTGAPTCPLTTGRFWDVNGKYVNAWRALQNKLADRYDSEPLIRQVAVTSCTQQTDEPFVPTTDKTAKNNLNAAGYTDLAQQGCLQSAATDDYASWVHTLIDYSFNPMGEDMAVTKDVMVNHCLAPLGRRCIVDTQAVGKSDERIDNTPILSFIQSTANGVNLQTASPRGMGNLPNQPPNMTIWNAAFSMANELRAKGLEVWSEEQYGGLDTMSMSQACSLLNTLLPGQTPQPPCQTERK